MQNIESKILNGRLVSNKHQARIDNRDAFRQKLVAETDGNTTVAASANGLCFPRRPCSTGVPLTSQAVLQYAPLSDLLLPLPHLFIPALIRLIPIPSTATQRSPHDSIHALPAIPVFPSAHRLRHQVRRRAQWHAGSGLSI